MGSLSAAIRDVFHAEAVQITPLRGGDLSKAVRITLADGQNVVAKTGALVPREARMLEAIAAADVPTPRVRGLSGEVLFLDWLETSLPGPCQWVKFGEDLARLHAVTGTAYGWPEEYAFGPVEIANAATDDWPTFWAERRLAPHLTHLPATLAARLETLAARLPDLLPAAPRPGLLHGDLWTGNLLATATMIHLIDPASYFGDGEVDLAMLHLFGGPGPGFADGYGPLAPGWQTRRAIYALFPALVHLRLFGMRYQGMVDRLLTAAKA